MHNDPSWVSMQKKNGGELMVFDVLIDTCIWYLCIIEISKFGFFQTGFLLAEWEMGTLLSWAPSTPHLTCVSWITFIIACGLFMNMHRKSIQYGFIIPAYQCNSHHQEPDVIHIITQYLKDNAYIDIFNCSTREYDWDSYIFRTLVLNNPYSLNTYTFVCMFRTTNSSYGDGRWSSKIRELICVDLLIAYIF